MLPVERSVAAHRNTQRRPTLCGAKVRNFRLSRGYLNTHLQQLAHFASARSLQAADTKQVALRLARSGVLSVSIFAPDYLFCFTAAAARRCAGAASKRPSRCVLKHTMADSRVLSMESVCVRARFISAPAAARSRAHTHTCCSRFARRHCCFWSATTLRVYRRIFEYSPQRRNTNTRARVEHLKRKYST